MCMMATLVPWDNLLLRLYGCQHRIVSCSCFLWTPVAARTDAVFRRKMSGHI
jgi:hypothetical protein